MVDSTYPLRPPSPRESSDHRPGSAGPRYSGAVPARRAILDLVGGEHWRLIRSLLQVDASEGRISADYAESPLRNVVSATIDAVHQAAVRERSPGDLDLLAFTVLGARCGGAAQDFADAVAVLDACAEAIRNALLIQAHQLDAVYGDRKIDKASASLCRVAEVVSHRAHDALLAGHEAALTGVLPPARWVSALQMLLDDRRRLSDLGDLLDGYDPSAFHSVYVFFGDGRDYKTGSPLAMRLADAGRDAQVLVPGAVDIGVGHSLHRRVVVDYRSRVESRRATALLRENRAGTSPASTRDRRHRGSSAFGRCLLDAAAPHRRQDPADGTRRLDRSRARGRVAPNASPNSVPTQNCGIIREEVASRCVTTRGRGRYLKGGIDMADSTQAHGAAPTAPPSDSESSDAVRSDLARLVDRQLPELTTTLVHGDASRGDASPAVAPPLAQLVHEAMPMARSVCHGGKPVRHGDVLPFRFLGATCAGDGIAAETAVATVTAAVESVADLLLARSHEFDGLWGEANVEQAVAAMCGDLEAFASSAARQIGIAYAHWANARVVHPSVDEEAALADVLTPREEADVDPDGKQDVLPANRRMLVAVIVATGQREDVPALARAAEEIETHLPEVVNLGLGEDQPTHWRVVVLRTVSQLGWDAQAVLRHVARRNGVVIVVRHPSVTLGRARAAYRDTVASLPEVIAAHGQRSTVVTSHAPTGPRTPIPVAA